MILSQLHLIAQNLSFWIIVSTSESSWRTVIYVKYLAFHKWYFNRKLLLLLSTASLHFHLSQSPVSDTQKYSLVTKGKKHPELPFYQQFRLSDLDEISASKSEMPHGERNSLWTGKKKKNLPLEAQWIVTSEPMHLPNQVVTKLSFEILSCFITHEMLGPEEVRNIPRNHWHETAAPSLQFLLPLRSFVLEAWQPLGGRSGPSSSAAGDPARLLHSYLSNVITDWSGGIKLLRKRDSSKGKVA